MLSIRLLLIALFVLTFCTPNAAILDIDQAAEDLQPNIQENFVQFREKLQDDSIPSQANLHQKKRFYASFSGGTTYNNNSESFVSGIRAIGDRMLTLIEGNSWSPIIKNILTGEINTISQFDGKIDFQWLGNTSLGCHISENGRIGSEIMNFTMNIQDNRHIFDKSASIFAFLLDLSYSPHIKDTKFTPYISLGVGSAIFRLKRVNQESKTKTIMPLNLTWYAYQIKHGIDYSIMQDFSIFLGYRYFNIPIPVANHISTHNIEVVVRLNF